MIVEKVGASTGHTVGTVFDVGADVQMSYSFGDVILRDQILIHDAQGFFAFSGDSGSLIVEQATKRAVGLLFAYSFDGTRGFFGIANHLNKALAALGATLVI
jgi:hypothetical protein